MALRGYHLDIPLSIALSDRPPLMSPQIVPPKIYYRVFIVLLLLTLTTTGVAFLHLEFLNPVLAIAIAACKASLVVLFFMHVRYSAKLTWVFIWAGLLWLTILMGLTLSDALTRNWIHVAPPWSSAAMR
jgi:cytochrome c oxidase subunit 4